LDLIFSHLKQYFQSAKDREILVYLWFFLLCILCFGILIPFLGFYWDDLPYLYQLHVFGTSGFPAYVAYDRPFSAWLFMITTGLFKFNPLGYHLFAFFLWFFGVILFYQILKEFWPEKKDFLIFASTIFAIYPGFLQQPIALIYCHHFSVLDIFLFSVLLMIKAARTEKVNLVLFIISILGSFQIFSIENFATLELIKPFLLWLIIEKVGIFHGIKLFKRVLLLWLPYLFIFIGFLVWRVYIFKFPTYEPGFFDAFSQNPGSTLLDLIRRIPVDFYTVTAGAWVKSFVLPRISSFGTSATVFFWVLVLFSFLFTFAVIGYYAKGFNSEKISGKNLLTISFIGILLFFLAGSIVWVLGLPLKIEFAWDRLTLAFIPSVAILMGGLLFSIKKIAIIRNFIFALLVALAVGSHFENGMRFKRDWENLQEMIWQLSWRIPALEKNTTLLTSETGLNYYSDNSLTSPVNLLYSDQKTNQLDYIVYFSDVRLGLGLKAFEKGLPIKQRYRSFYFSGNTSQMIAFKFNPPSCFQIMDRVYSNSITNPNLSDVQVREIRMTDLSLIQNQPQKSPPLYLFANDSENTWCYYFEKADLARQFGDFSQIAQLGDTALKYGLSPRSAAEWLPFLEGYSWMGQWEKVDYILNEIATAKGNFRSGICYTLTRIKNNNHFLYVEKIQEYLKGYNCE
jgi:hypothetical protein